MKSEKRLVVSKGGGVILLSARSETRSHARTSILRTRRWVQKKKRNVVRAESVA